MILFCVIQNEYCNCIYIFAYYVLVYYIVIENIEFALQILQQEKYAAPRYEK